MLMSRSSLLSCTPCRVSTRCISPGTSTCTRSTAVLLRPPNSGIKPLICRAVLSEGKHDAAHLHASSSSTNEDVGRRQLLLAIAGATLALSGTLIVPPGWNSRALAEEPVEPPVSVPGIYEGRPILPSECAELYAFASATARRIVGRANAPVILRLAFHDAFTFDAFAPEASAGGPNASIAFETDRPENKGLKRGLRIIDAIQKEIQESGLQSEVTLSRADLIAIAGAEAVAATGGPEFQVPVGRVDASGPDPEGRMPMENMTAASLKARFSSAGYSVKEMVCLSGAHTLGTKGFGKADEFDNAYFVMLKARPWETQDDAMNHVGIDTDRAIAYDPECIRWISYYAASQNDFWADFAKSYTRMVTQGAKWRQLN